jgi:uncharacterized protein YjbK
MSGSNLPITSREYKLMLNVERFKDRNEGSEMFLDTEELTLHRRGFALRLREETKTSAEFQINFKYRASDRYISAAQDVSSTQQAATKFEEDILPPFVSKFSHSTSIKTGTLPDLSSVTRVASLFPAVTNLDLQGDPSVETIKDFRAAEVVRTGRLAESQRDHKNRIRN